MKIITKEEFSRATKLNKVYMPGLASILMEVMKINEVNKVFQKAEHLSGISFIDKILQVIGIKVDFDEKELKNLPQNGAFIVIANHPYGGIEGLILLKIMFMKRPDSKLMANFLLKKIPNLSEHFIAVNPFETIEHTSSISGIKQTPNASIWDSNRNISGWRSFYFQGRYPANYRQVMASGGW